MSKLHRGRGIYIFTATLNMAFNNTTRLAIYTQLYQRSNRHQLGNIDLPRPPSTSQQLSTPKCASSKKSACSAVTVPTSVPAEYSARIPSRDGHARSSSSVEGSAMRSAWLAASRTTLLSLQMGSRGGGLVRRGLSLDGMGGMRTESGEEEFATSLCCVPELIL